MRKGGNRFAQVKSIYLSLPRNNYFVYTSTFLLCSKELPIGKFIAPVLVDVIVATQWVFYFHHHITCNVMKNSKPVPTPTEHKSQPSQHLWVVWDKNQLQRAFEFPSDFDDEQAVRVQLDSDPAFESILPIEYELIWMRNTKNLVNWNHKWMIQRVWPDKTDCVTWVLHEDNERRALSMFESSEFKVDRVWYLGHTDDLQANMYWLYPNRNEEATSYPTEDTKNSGAFGDWSQIEPVLPEWLVYYKVRDEEFETIVSGKYLDLVVHSFLPDADPDTVIDAIIRSDYGDGTFKPRTGNPVSDPTTAYPDAVTFRNSRVIRGALVLSEMARESWDYSELAKYAQSLRNITQHSMDAALKGIPLNRQADNSAYSFALEVAQLFEYMLHGDNGTWKTSQLLSAARQDNYVTL